MFSTKYYRSAIGFTRDPGSAGFLTRVRVSIKTINSISLSRDTSCLYCFVVFVASRAVALGSPRTGIASHPDVSGWQS